VWREAIILPTTNCLTLSSIGVSIGVGVGCFDWQRKYRVYREERKLKQMPMLRQITGYEL